MKYVVLLMGDGEVKPWGEMSEQEKEVVFQQFEDFDTACSEARGVQILAAEALGSADTATVVRTRGGRRTITDGPYAEAVEQLGGVYVIETPNLDVLLDLLTRLPAYDLQISPAIDPS